MKTIKLTTLTLFMAFTLIGCGGGSSSSGSNESNSGAKDQDNSTNQLDGNSAYIAVTQEEVYTPYDQIEGDLATLGEDLKVLKKFDNIAVSDGLVTSAKTSEVIGLNGNTLYTLALFSSRYAKGSNEWNGTTPNDYVLTKSVFPARSNGKTAINIQKTHKIYSNTNNDFKPENRNLGEIIYHYYSPEYGYSMEKDNGQMSSIESSVVASKMDYNSDALLVDYQKTAQSPKYTVVYDKVNLSGKTIASIVSGQLRFTYSAPTVNFEGFSETDKFPSNSYAYVPRFIKVSEHFFSVLRPDIDGYSDTFDNQNEWEVALKNYGLIARSYESESKAFGSAFTNKDPMQKYIDLNESIVSLSTVKDGEKLHYASYQPAMIYRPNLNGDTSQYAQILFNEVAGKALDRTLYDSVYVAL